MKKNNRDKKILIIDFGSQYTQLIARRVRELGVFSEISNHKQVKKVDVEELSGIILSGGPLNVYEDKKINFNKPNRNLTLSRILNNFLIIYSLLISSLSKFFISFSKDSNHNIS